MYEDGVYRSDNNFFNHFVEEMAAEYDRRQEEERKNETPHVFLLATVITFLGLLWGFAFTAVLFFLHYWYWLLIAWVLLPIPEYAPQYSDQLASITGLILGPINDVFIPTLNALWNCLNEIRVVYNHVVQIIRAVLHIVLVQVEMQFGTGIISFFNVFVVIKNVLTFVFFIVEMVAMLITTVAKELVSLFDDSGDTFDFSFITLIVNIIIDVIAKLLDPYKCFTPVSDIPYSLLECLSRGNIPHPMLQRAAIKSAGVDGIVKAVIIIVCGKGELSTGAFDLILDCIDFDAIGELFLSIFSSQEVMLTNLVALNDSLNVLENQFNMTNAVLESMLPTLVNQVLNKLCGNLKDTVYCDSTKTIVSNILQQGHILQQIHDTPINTNHTMIISDPVQDTKVCVFDRKTHREIICIHTVGYLNRLKVGSKIDQLRKDIGLIHTHITEAHDITLDVITNITARVAPNMTSNDYREIQMEIVRQNANRSFNVMSDESINYLRNTSTNANDSAYIETLPNLRPHQKDILAYYATQSERNIGIADIILDITSQMLSIGNATVLSWRRGRAANDNYFFVRDHLMANGFNPQRVFDKINKHYGMTSVATMQQNAAGVDITIIGALASFALTGGSTFAKLLNGFFVIVVGLIMFASMILGALGGLINALNNTPGFHFDFGANVMTAPIEQFLTIGVSEPIPASVIQNILIKYVTVLTQLIEVILLNILRLLLCEFPVNLGGLTCPPEIYANFDDPQILQITYSYLFNITMCTPDTCMPEGSHNAYGSLCVNGTILCWPELPYITIPPINAVEMNDLSMCTVHDVAIGRGIAWYRLPWNWVAFTFTNGFQFIIRVMVAGYTIPWVVLIVSLLASRICICVRSAWYLLTYVTIFQLTHYPAQILPLLCPSGRLFGLCDRYQNYILFSAVDNTIPPDAITCNLLAIPVYILGGYIIMMLVLLVATFINAALFVSIWKDLVIAYKFVEFILVEVFTIAQSHVEPKEKLE